MADISEVLPFTAPKKLLMEKQLIAVINQLQHYDLVIVYPHHFYLYITPILLLKRTLSATSNHLACCKAVIEFETHSNSCLVLVLCRSLGLRDLALIKIPKLYKN